MLFAVLAVLTAGRVCCWPRLARRTPLGLALVQVGGVCDVERTSMQMHIQVHLPHACTRGCPSISGKCASAQLLHPRASHVLAGREQQVREPRSQFTRKVRPGTEQQMGHDIRSDRQYALMQMMHLSD